LPPPHATASMSYGMPGYDSTTFASTTTTAAPTMSSVSSTTSLPITNIPFPRSPSQIPAFDVPPFVPSGATSAPTGTGGHDRLGVLCFSKLDFATYDGAKDPLNWLHRCEHFFRGQHTLALDRVGSPRTT